MADDKVELPTAKDTSPPIALSEFLESTPPSQLTGITELSDLVYVHGNGVSQILTPDVQLHCDNDACNGLRFFRCVNDSRPRVSTRDFEFIHLTYVCSNCQKNRKVFSLAALKDKEGHSGHCYKFGELPPYGPPTPARLIKLIGPDREIFLKGRRCENQGLGIGAFVYYRRVVENQKNRILDEIIKVSQKLNLAADKMALLEAAKREVQFSKAVESVKDAIPQAILINGHNPLMLLHSALSNGLHEQTDEHCLEIASSVRVVLGELSDRLGQALKDEAELNNALSKLMSKGKQAK